MSSGTPRQKDGAWSALFVIVMLIWLLILPIYALGMAFSGFLALSPFGLVLDIMSLPSSIGQVTGRLLCWLYLLWPLISYRAFVSKRAQS